MNENKSKLSIVWVLILGFILGGIGVYLVKNNYQNDLPNGSTNAWSKKFTINSETNNKPISTTMPSEYIGVQGGVWPPIIKISAISYSCKVSSGSGDVPTIIEEKIINGKKYCVTHSSEGAMSHIYTDYTYTTQYNNGTKTTNFVLSKVSCGVYDQPKYNECEKVESDFNQKSIDLFIDSLMFN